MALITEDGTIVAGAESLCSVDVADAYHLSIGNESTWFDLDPEVKEVNLRKATMFMRRVYRARWAGCRVSSLQTLDWPRYGVVVDDFTIASNTVPADVQYACAELALKVQDGELMPDLDTGVNQVKKEVIGPLETEYFEVNTDAGSRFVSVDALLAPYFGVNGGTSSIKLVRG